ncbi:DUF4142 domain-containing protein [Achromobacter spanius]|uniref:DUF4142 domain-containing protein n=1 Tax=Achromobacter spanius TaxID=217203 RepID=UPI0036F02C59
MKTRTLTAALLSVSLLGAGSVAVAQQTAPATPSTPGAPASPTTPASPGAPAAAPMAESRLDGKDRDFLENAAQSGHMEVEGSKMALEKSQNAEVKKFAQQMIDDHTKAGQQLAALAKSKGVDVPTDPSLMQQAKLKTLGLRDEGFDEAYAEGVGVSAHEDAVKLFEEASNEAKDPEVKQFATETLPKLQQHLQMAKTLDQSVKNAKPK